MSDLSTAFELIYLIFCVEIILSVFLLLVCLPDNYCKTVHGGVCCVG